MRFRNSLKLLMENFKQVYKLLFSKFIISLIAVALCCSFVLPELSQIFNDEATKTLFSDVSAFIHAFFSANGAEMETIRARIIEEGGSLQRAFDVIASRRTELWLTIMGVAIVYLIRRFAETICHYTAGSILGDKMSTYADTPFWTSMIANLGKASVYALVYVPIVFVIDVLTLCIAYFVLSAFSVVTALFLTMTLIVVCQSLKLTLTGRWMPAMDVDGKGIGKAIVCENKTERKQQLKMFSVYLVCVYFVIILNVLGALATFGSALLITVPASYFLFICVQYVGYYTVKGKKYFLTFENIEKNPDHGDSEHYFDYVTDAKAEENENGKE